MPAQNSRSIWIRGGAIGAGAFFFRFGPGVCSGAVCSGAEGAGADCFARFRRGGAGSGSAGEMGAGASVASGTAAGGSEVDSMAGDGSLAGSVRSWFLYSSEKSRVIVNAVPASSSRFESASRSSKRSRWSERTPHSM